MMRRPRAAIDKESQIQAEGWVRVFLGPLLLGGALFRRIL